MNNVKVETIGTNKETYSGITVKAGQKYYIISKSPMNGEVMVFRCDSKGHCSNKADIWLGTSFDDAIEFLSTNQP